MNVPSEYKKVGQETNKKCFPGDKNIWRPSMFFFAERGESGAMMLSPIGPICRTNLLFHPLPVVTHKKGTNKVTQ